MVGNKPNYNPIDILRTFLTINENSGRNDLSRKLNLGEGTLRTILDILKKKNILSSTRKGHSLTKKGKNYLKQTLQNISLPNSIKLKNPYPSYKKVGILVKKVSPKKTISFLERDIAVKNGADAALIFRYKNKLTLPSTKIDFKKDYKDSYNKLIILFNPKNNDILILTFSNSYNKAENAALMVALSLNEKLKDIVNRLIL